MNLCYDEQKGSKSGRKFGGSLRALEIQTDDFAEDAGFPLRHTGGTPAGAKEVGAKMTADEILFWDRWPQLLPVYEAFRRCLAEAYPDMKTKVSKTQISFYNRHMFAMASPPVRRRKDWPKEFVMVSFGLPYQVVSPRIAMSVEAYPKRWTHHVIVENAAAIDEALLAWIDAAYSFSECK